MIEGTKLQATALRMFASDTKRYVAAVLDLVTALEDDDELTAALLLIYVGFVSDSARTVLERASLDHTAHAD